MKSIWTYQHRLPVISRDNIVSLGEGDTPLVRSRKIGPAMGLDNLFFKLENLNPTGSYKDRFASPVVSLLREQNHKICICTSSGNTGSALAAYCAAASIRCIVITVDGAPEGKLRQMQLYGAEVQMVRGFGKDAAVTTEVFDVLATYLKSVNLPFPVSAYQYHPEGMRGVETLAEELLTTDQPEHVFSPAGGGGLTLAICRGLKPGVAVHCVQPDGNNTIAGHLRDGRDKATAVSNSTTAISGLQVASVLDGDEVIRSCRASGGTGQIVSDQDVFTLQKKLAFEEGIFCEAAGAVALAGALQAVKNNEVDPRQRIVCLVTGSGFKDISGAEKSFGLPGPEYLDSTVILEKKLEQLRSYER